MLARALVRTRRHPSYPLGGCCRGSFACSGGDPPSPLPAKRGMIDRSSGYHDSRCNPEKASSRNYTSARSSGYGREHPVHRTCGMSVQMHAREKRNGTEQNRTKRNTTKRVMNGPAQAGPSLHWGTEMTGLIVSHGALLEKTTHKGKCGENRPPADGPGSGSGPDHPKTNLRPTDFACLHKVKWPNVRFGNDLGPCVCGTSRSGPKGEKIRIKKKRSANQLRTQVTVEHERT